MTVMRHLPKTRAGILELIKRRGRATIVELAAELDMTHEGVRVQIQQLQKDGLVVSGCENADGAEGDGGAPSAGRPAAFYCLTVAGDHVFPKRYEQFALLLMEAAERSGDAAGVDDLLATVTDLRVEQLPAGTAKSPVRVLQSVYLKRDPFIELIRRDGDWVIVERNCPFLTVALERPEICSTTVSMMRRVAGCEVVRERRFQDGDARCEFRLMRDRPLAAPPRFEIEPPKDAARVSGAGSGP